MTKNLQDLLPDLPSWLRIFNRDYQLRTVMRMNDLLAEKGVEQKDIAERTGWSKGYVSRLLSGRGNLTLRTVAKFEAAVGGRVLQIVESAPSALQEREKDVWSSASMDELAARALSRPVMSTEQLRLAARSVTHWKEEKLSDG